MHYLLSPINTVSRSKDLLKGLEFGNHKGAITHKNIITKLMETDIIHTYNIILSLRATNFISDSLLTPMSMVEQNTITEHCEIVPKKQITHNQSKLFAASGTSVNKHVNKKELQDCMYGHYLIRMIHNILALQRS